MNNKILIFWATLFTVFVTFDLNAQNCQMYFPDEVGTVREMKSLDKDGKPLGYTKQEVIGKTNSGSAIVLQVRSTAFNPEYEEMNSGDLSFRCEGGVFRFLMEEFNSPNTMGTDMAILLSGDELLYPSQMKVGDKLPDANFTMAVKKNESTLLTTAVKMENRVVEGKESITTDAGTFSCYKIKYNTHAKISMFTVRTTEIEWVAPGVGTVKSESYNKKGKLSGSSFLSKYHKG